MLARRGCTLHSPNRALLAHSSALFCALLHNSERHPLFFQSSPHSLRVYPGWHSERSSFSCSSPVPGHSFTLPARQPLGGSLERPLSSLESSLGHPVKDGHPEEPLSATKGLLLTPLESALGHPVKDGHPEEPLSATKGLLLTPLESALTARASCNPLYFQHIQKTWRVGDVMLTSYPTRIAVLPAPVLPGSERSESKDLSSHAAKHSHPACPESRREELSSATRNLLLRHDPTSLSAVAG